RAATRAGARAGPALARGAEELRGGTRGGLAAAALLRGQPPAAPFRPARQPRGVGEGRSTARPPPPRQPRGGQQLPRPQPDVADGPGLPVVLVGAGPPRPGGTVGLGPEPARAVAGPTSLKIRNPK